MFLVFLLFNVLILNVRAEENSQAQTIDAKNYSLELVSDTKDFPVNRHPDFEFKFKKKRGVFGSIGAFAKSIFKDEYKNIKIDQNTVQAINGDSITGLNPKVEYEKNGKFKISLSDLPRQFKPGKYRVNVTVADSTITSGQPVSFSQDFTWGVLALNVNKSIYNPGETAFLQMAVLNEEGHTLCDADLTFAITAPDGKVSQFTTNPIEKKFSVSDFIHPLDLLEKLKDKQTIVKNSKCGPDNVIDEPDYYAYFQTVEAGDYKIDLHAKTANGEYDISDSFVVQSDLAFDIERIGPTRINPEHGYEMKVKIKANQDYTGNLIEQVPLGFSISDFRFSNNENNEIKSKIENRKSEISLAQELIVTNVEIKSGETYVLSYKFDAPDVSPEFFLLGPLETEIGNRKSAIENRQWQIASDALTSLRAKTIQVLAGTYSGNGTTGQNSDTDQTFSTFNFELPENNVIIKNAYVVFESQYEAYGNYGNYTGYSLYFDACQNSCTANALTGTGRVTQSDATVLSYNSTTDSTRQLHLIFNVTSEAQLAAYQGVASGTMNMQVGYRLNKGSANASIANASAKLIVTYTYDKDSPSIANTVYYPLNSVDSGAGSKATSTSDDCVFGVSCPAFGYNFEAPEYKRSISKWFQFYNQNDSSTSNTNHVVAQAKIGSSATGTDYIYEQLTGKVDQGNLPIHYFDNLSGFSENTAQQVQYRGSSAGTVTHYLIGGEVAETYIASSSAATSTRTAIFPLGVLTNGNAAGTSTVFADIYFPENGPDTGTVAVKSAWFRIKSNNITSGSASFGVRSKVGNNASSSIMTYLYDSTAQVARPNLDIINVIPAAGYSELAGANRSTAKRIYLEVNTGTANTGGISAELLITYSYTSERYGYLSSLNIFAGQSATNPNNANPGGRGYAASMGNSVLPETAGVKTMLAAGLNTHYIMSDSDGGVGTPFTTDARIGTVAPTCANAYYMRTDAIGAESDFIKTVTASMNTTDNQSYFVCMTNNGAADANSGGSKMNSTLTYTYELENNLPTSTISSLVQRTDASGIVDITVKFGDLNSDELRAKMMVATGTACDFTSATPIDPTLDTNNVTATSGTPVIDNGAIYQIGTSSNTILSAGGNTVNFDWLSKSDLDNRQGTYCIGIMANDGIGDQSPIATATIALDNYVPKITAMNIPNLAYKIGDTLRATLTVETDADVFIKATSTINNATTTNLVKVNNTTYTLDYLILSGDTDRSSGTIPMSIRLQDSKGNVNSASTTVQINTASIDANRPVITAVTAQNLMYGIGDTLTATITVNSETENLGPGQLTVSTINNKTAVNLRKINDTTYEFDYTVVEGDDNHTASGSIPVLIVLRDWHGNESANFTVLTSSASLDAVRPVIANVYITSNNYGIGDAVSVVIDADQTGYHEFAITVNGKPVTGFYDNADTTYNVTYTVAEGDTDRTENNIPVSVVIADRYGNENIPAVTVPFNNNATIDAHKPEILSISIPSRVYKIGDVVRATTTVTADTHTYTLGTTTINLVPATNLQRINDSTYTFDYTVQSGDNDCGVGAIPISLMLKDQLGQYNNPASTTVQSNTARIDANAPAVSSVVFVPSSGLLKIGDTATATITALGDEAGLVTGTTININNKNVKGTFVEMGLGLYRITYTVVEGDDYHPDGDDLPVNIILRDSAGNESAAYQTPDSTNRPGVDAVRPVISNVSFLPSSGVLKIGDTATATIYSDGINYASGTIMINGVNVAATLASAGGNDYTVTYTVSEGDDSILDTENLPVDITLLDTAGNPSIAYTTADSGNRPGVDAERPVIQSVAFLPSSGVLKIGDTATATITVANSETGLASSTTMTVNGIDISGTFTEIGGGQYRITYTVFEGHTDILDANDLPVNLAVKDAAGNSSLPFTTVDAGNRPGVDGHKPVISDVTFSPSSGILKIGDTATATIAADGTGYTAVAITINGVNVAATLASAGGNNYRVSYTVIESDNDISEISDLPVYIVLRDPAGNNSVAYNAADPSGRPGVDANAPAINSVVFEPLSGVLKVGDIATATITASGAETGLASGTIMTINGVSVSGSFTEIGSGQYRVVYLVSEGNDDIADNTDLPVALTLRDNAGNVSTVYNTADAGNRPGVDAHTPTITAVSFNPSSGVLKIGATATATITAANSETGLSSTTGMMINGVEVSSTFTEIGSGQYRVSYTVVEGQTDVSDASDLPISFRIKDAAGNISPVYTTANAGGRPGVDAHAPTVPGNLSFVRRANNSITLLFGATTTESNFAGYKIFYKSGTGGVSESDSEWNSGNDSNLGNILFNNAASTTVTGLTIGTDYYFNIIAYDTAGNKTFAAQELSANTNHAPSLPSGLLQYKTDSLTEIANGEWTNENTIKLLANTNDQDAGDVLTLYFEIASSSDAFANSRASACAFNEIWQNCPSRVWATTSPAGDYSLAPFSGLANPLSLPNGYSGYKWQVSACDQSGACSTWNTIGTNPNFKVDYVAPIAPGSLTFNSKTYESVTLNFNGPASEANFREYIVYYKIGTTSVSESDFAHSSSSDINLANINFNGQASTTILGLTSNTDYVFNIWAYDLAGNKVSASEITVKTIPFPYPPTGSFNFAEQKIDGSGRVRISIEADDRNNEDTLRARIDYVLGAACNFSVPLDPTLDEEQSSISQDSGMVVIDNSSLYQVGTTSGWIWTSLGSNTVDFDWLSALDLPNASSTYCLRLTVNDGGLNQVVSATTTVYIDNVKPTNPGSLSLAEKHTDNLVVSFGTTTTETNFREYKIYYKIADGSAPTENDMVFASTSDANLASKTFGGAATTTIGGLFSGTEYSFAIWAYDQYGNRASSTYVDMITNHIPSIPTNLEQYHINETTKISNGAWTIEDVAKIRAEANDDDINESITLFFELIANSDTFTTATTTPFNACAANDSWADCSSKIWKISSVIGDYSSLPYTGTTSPANLPNSNSGFKWQVIACDTDNACSEWARFNDAIPNFKIDFVPPTVPGSLSVSSFTSHSITLNFGATTTEENFKEYIIYYKEGTSGVTEANTKHGSSTDANMAHILFNNATSTTVENLNEGTDYVFNIFAYDQAGNRTAAIFEISTTTNNRPTSTIVSAASKTDGSGAVDIAFDAGDLDLNDSIAKIEYVFGGDCNFASPHKATLDEIDENATSTFGDIKIENDNAYQIGNPSGWIITASGTNTINFDWLSRSDEANGDGVYCLRLTVNDNIEDQAISATTTVVIDNAAPTIPGDLSIAEIGGTSLTLAFGATTTETNFKEYRIFYKKGVATVDENSLEHDDPDLDNKYFNYTATTTLSGLDIDSQYSFKIYAYDLFGNKSNSGQTIFKTNAAPTGSFNSAAQRTDKSGIVDLSIEVYDIDLNYCQAKIEYATGTTCNFSNAGDPTLDEDQANISAVHGSVGINNNNSFQIGTSTAMIKTSEGSNTINFDWFAKQDLPNGNGKYCLRLTVSDGISYQAVSATTSLTIDNVPPSIPGNLGIESVAGMSVNLIFGATSSDSNFKEYKIFYRMGISGVSETDDVWNKDDDIDLGFSDFNYSTTTRVSMLNQYSQYVFNIWAYDYYGNSSQAALEVSTTTINLSSATWRENQNMPDPTIGLNLGKNEPIRLRIAVENTGDWYASDYQYALEYGVKNGNCASVSAWTPVATSTVDKQFAMINSDYFNNGSSTSQRLTGVVSSFIPGYMIEYPYRESGLITLAGDQYTELEYDFWATAIASSGPTYCFRVTDHGNPLDGYGLYPELTLAPPPIAVFNSAMQITGATGEVNISIDVSDFKGRDTRVKLEYASGTDCIFSSALDPSLDQSSEKISADYGHPLIDNSSVYQIGTTTGGMILTRYGSNTVNFNWNALLDIPGADSEYCLRLTANDGFDDQFIPATTTVVVDYAPPSVPGNLSVVSKTLNSVTLGFGTSSVDSNFSHYSIYYKEGASGVTESDFVHSTSSDANLDFANYQTATTTTINGLSPNKQYVFRIWAYDIYGNESVSALELTTKTVPSFRGHVYTDEGVTILNTGPSVSIAVGGVFVKTITANTASGLFSFDDIDPPATGTPIVIYLDGTPEKGATYNRYSGAGEINDFDIYQNKVIVKHDDAGPLSVSDMNTYDSDQDGDIPCTVSGLSLSVNSGYELYVWPGDTFESGSGDIASDDIRIKGSFSAVGSQQITVTGNWDATGGYFSAASSTVVFTGSGQGQIIKTNNSPFWNLTLDSAGAEWILFDSSTTTATTTINQGALVQGGNANFETGSLVIELGASFVKATGTGILIFEDRGIGYFEDKNDVKNNLGNVQIGYSPAVTMLGSDMVADSLVVSSGDKLYSRGYELDITNQITVNGTLDCIDDKEGDGTIITLGTDWTVAPSGIFVAGNSTTTFDNATGGIISTGGTDANHDFYNLSFAKTAATTTTLNGYPLKISGDLNIGANSTLDVSSANHDIYAGGNWLNSGIFIARNATTTFDAVASSKAINPGNSAFNRVMFDGATGGWTISGNATSSSDWVITNASAFSIATNVIIEVKGRYIISDTIPSITTWNSGSTLFLNNGGAYALATKNQSAEVYANLKIGANTDIKMWNSSSSASIVDPTGSLYAMDYGNVDGSLYIWGEYINSSSADYWSRTTDFDGADISGAPRTCQVRIASGASILENGGGLQAIGSASATTTISSQGSGTYALEIASGTLQANFYQIRNTDASGIKISGTTTVTSLSNGDFELGVEGGALISVSSNVINANPWATTTDCRFATSTGITSGYNVKLSGVPLAPWTFTAHYGNFSGEAFDSDPGDPRGYLLWDDSPSYAPKSQNWRWYHDEDKETPLDPIAGENISPLIIGNGNLVKLRLTIAETSGIPATNVKMRLQYSTDSSFASNVGWVGEKGSTTALWNYGEGIDNDNDQISSLLLSDSTAKATHNESGISTSSYAQTALRADEWEFTLLANNVSTSTTYYFRAFSDYYSVYSNYSKIAVKNDSNTYPSVVVSGAVLSFSIQGLPDNTNTEGVITDFSTTATSVPFGILPLNTQIEGAHRFIITTNAESGYQLFVYQRQNLISNTGAYISSISSTNDNPGPWPVSPDPGAFGYHAGDDSLSGNSPSRFSPDNMYARFNSGLEEISYSPMPVNNDTVDFVYRVEVNNLQSAGDYKTNIVYILVPQF